MRGKQQHHKPGGKARVLAEIDPAAVRAMRKLFGRKGQQATEAVLLQTLTQREREALDAYLTPRLEALVERWTAEHLWHHVRGENEPTDPRPTLAASLRQRRSDDHPS